MKRPATRTEIARRNKVSRTTVYRAARYLETRGEHIEPRKKISPVFTGYKYLYKDSYRKFTRNFYDTPTRKSVYEVIRKEKPVIVMLQGWFKIVITQKTPDGWVIIYDDIASGISIPIEVSKFSYSDKMGELKRFSIANARIRFDSAAVEIDMRLAKDRNGKNRLRTIGYFRR